MKLVDENYYKTSYKTAESRVLYLVAQKGYGSFTKMAESLGVSRQYLRQCVEEVVPIKYAGFLARKHKFHPGLLNYKLYLLMGGEFSFDKLLNETNFFNKYDKHYILKGFCIKELSDFLKQTDKEVIA